MGKVRPRGVTCFAEGYTGCERSDTGVWVPASVASVLSRAVSTDLFGKPSMEARNSHAFTLFARPHYNWQTGGRVVAKVCLSFSCSPPVLEGRLV